MTVLRNSITVRSISKTPVITATNEGVDSLALGPSLINLLLPAGDAGAPDAVKGQGERGDEGKGGETDDNRCSYSTKRRSMVIIP